MKKTLILLFVLSVFQGMPLNAHQNTFDTSGFRNTNQPKKTVIRLVNSAYSSTLPASEDQAFKSVQAEYASDDVLFYELKWDTVDDIKAFFAKNNINLQVKQNGKETSIYNSKVNLVGSFNNALLVMEETSSVWFCTDGDCGRDFLERRLSKN